jgi:hypothetical protein
VAEITEICAFITRADSVKLETKTGEDTITVIGINLNQNDAASLAWLIKNDATTNLRFRITLKEPS